MKEKNQQRKQNYNQFEFIPIGLTVVFFFIGTRVLSMAIDEKNRLHKQNCNNNYEIIKFNQISASVA